jgi:hypothetical protein
MRQGKSVEFRECQTLVCFAFELSCQIREFCAVNDGFQFPIHVGVTTKNICALKCQTHELRECLGDFLFVFEPLVRRFDLSVRTTFRVRGAVRRVFLNPLVRPSLGRLLFCLQAYAYAGSREHSNQLINAEPADLSLQQVTNAWLRLAKKSCCFSLRPPSGANVFSQVDQ